MIIPFLMLFIAAIILFFVAYNKKDGSHIRAFKITGKTTLNLLPLLIVAFIMAGFLEVVIPPELIHQWLGEQSGLLGIGIGSVAGALIPGGPYVAFPIIAAIYKAGAGMGTVVAFIAGWSMWGVINIPFEVALVGPKFTALRYTLVILLPPIAGLLAYAIF